MPGQWKPIVVMTGGTNQVPAIKASDLAPGNSIGDVLAINTEGGEFDLEWQTYWDHTTEPNGYTGNSFYKSVGGSYANGSWVSDPLLASQHDSGFGNHPVLDSQPGWVTGADPIANEDVVGVFSGFDILVESDNPAGHVSAGALSFTTAELKLSQLSTAGTGGMPQDLNANLYEHKTYGTNEVIYALNWDGGPQNGTETGENNPAVQDNRFRIATDITVDMQNNNHEGHPQNLPYEIFKYGEDTVGSLQMNGTLQNPYLFESELKINGVRHVNTDDVLNLSVSHHDLHIYDIKYSQLTDCNDPAYMATATSNEITACKNNDDADFVSSAQSFTGAWNADYFKYWKVQAASSTLKVGSTNTFQYGDAGDEADLTGDFAALGDTTGISFEMEDPVETFRTNDSHWSYTDSQGTPHTEAITDGSNVPLITVQGVYGTNNRVRQIEAGVGFHFNTLGKHTNLTGGEISLGLPSTLSATTDNSASGTTHTHEIQSTWNGADNANFGGDYDMILRSTGAAGEAASSGMVDGSLQLQDLQIHEDGTFWDGTNNIVFHPSGSINDPVVQLNVVYSDIEGYCSESTIVTNEYDCVSAGGTCGDNTYDDDYDGCFQAAGTCVCADGSGVCGATGTETYSQCEALVDPANWNGYGDGVGGFSTNAEWVVTNSWAADNVWIATEIDSYGEFPISGELGDSLAVGLVLGNAVAKEGGAVTIGTGSSVAGTYVGTAGTFDHPVRFRNPSNLAYKGLEIGSNKWNSITQRELGFDMTDGSTGIAAHGDSDYNRNALMGIGTGSSWIDAGDEHVSDGVLTIIPTYSSFDNTTGEGANSGNMVLNPSNQVGNTSFYDSEAVPDQPGISGTGYNLALGIGTYSADGGGAPNSAGSYIVADSGGSLSCDYIILGDIGDINTTTDPAYMIDQNLLHTTQNGMLVAKHGADSAGGGLYLLHNV
tara:strand:- start:936 stop:3761 length:2826 start_codon:yes stop_codon:yes gene_type:complete